MKKTFFFALVATLLLFNQVSFAQTPESIDKSSSGLRLDAFIVGMGGEKIKIDTGLNVVPGSKVFFVGKYVSSKDIKTPSFEFWCSKDAPVISGEFHISSEGDLVTDDLECEYVLGGVPNAKIEIAVEGNKVSADRILSVAFPKDAKTFIETGTPNPYSSPGSFLYAIILVILAGIVYVVVHKNHKNISQ